MTSRVTDRHVIRVAGHSTFEKSTGYVLEPCAMHFMHLRVQDKTLFMKPWKSIPF